MKIIIISLVVILSIFTNIPDYLMYLIMGVTLLYVFFDIGINHNLTLANLVINKNNPSETDKNIGKTTSIIALLMSVLSFFLSIYTYLSE